MAGEKTMRMEELEEGQQDMQKKIAQMTKMVTSLTKGKGTPRETSLGKAVIPKGNVPIAKVWKNEVGSSLTIEGSKE